MNIFAIMKSLFIYFFVCVEYFFFRSLMSSYYFWPSVFAPYRIFWTLKETSNCSNEIEKIEHHWNYNKSYWAHLQLTNYATAVVQLIIKKINVFQAQHNYMFSWNGSLIYKQLCLARSLRSWRKMVQNLALPNTG